MPRVEHGSCRRGRGYPHYRCRIAGRGTPGSGAHLRPEAHEVMSRHGFTLIELLIVVVIIGILAAIAIPKFANTKEKAYIASMKSDLRNLVTAEEAYFADSVKYSATTACTTPPTAGAVNFCVTTGNNLGTVGLAAGNGGWAVTITNNNLTAPLVRCAIFINTAVLAPAVSEGAPACS